MNDIKPGVMTITLVTQKHGNLKRVWSKNLDGTIREAAAFAYDRPDSDTSWFWDAVPEGINEWAMTVPLLEGAPVDSSGTAEIKLTGQMGITLKLVGLPPQSVIDVLEAI